MVWLLQIAWKAPGSNLPRLLHETGPKTKEISDNLNVEPFPLFAAEIFADPGILDSCMNLTFQCFLVTLLESGH